MSIPDDTIFYDPEPRPRRRRNCCLGCLGRLIGTLLLLALLAVVGVIVAFFAFPPFGSATTARVLLVGLDEPEFPGAARRSDAIILMAVHLDGRGAAMLSVPRDARVRIPGHRGNRKINAAYALGGLPLLRETLADDAVLGAELPYVMVFDSSTLRALVDAAGGVPVTVDRRMDYDDDWGHLHIHLQPGQQTLNGEQAVGYVRWRKNHHGEGGNSTDFERGARQREVVTALAAKLTTLQGLRRVPAVYKAFRTHTQTNLTLRHLALLAWRFRNAHSLEMPAGTRTIGGVSYVLCDWPAGRAAWQQAAR
jgi:LCP family protein required for cell wall assembly